MALPPGSRYRCISLRRTASIASGTFPIDHPLALWLRCSDLTIDPAPDIQLLPDSLLMRRAPSHADVPSVRLSSPKDIARDCSQQWQMSAIERPLF
ncbi:hypothetical protein [Breoghania sp.]|uniref:hypothetical protein n=1 Tax=Breoghania sp. TaxID=2065378 RepID=UPI0026340AC0|nr:hypothetical protein [Breoghania sp.]MDJ0930743.1 hypothetical protein [Breoghania sp.]